MRKVILYLLGLSVAAAAVFFATYFLGRHSSLEEELERLTSPGTASPPAAKSGGIPSLQPVEPAVEAPQPPSSPGGEPLGEGMSVTRSPLEPAGLAIVVDLPSLATPGDGGGLIGAGLGAFLRQPPAGVSVGARALAGAPGECGWTDAIAGMTGAGAELAVALERAAGLGQGPRNPAKALEAASADLEAVPGERVAVIIAGGEEGCGADLCGAGPPPGGGAQRIHVILVAPPPVPGSEPTMPDAGSAAGPAPVFDPPWAAPYRCLAERSGGGVEAVTSAAALERALRRTVARLESAVSVRAFHYTGQELKGISPDGAAGWGAVLRPSGGAAAGGESLEAGLFPAAFSVPAGVYVLKSRYGGQERTAAVAVAPGERAEVRVAFATGELFVRALDAAGGEIVGDSAGFRCAWGAEVLQGDDGEERTAATTCSFPARLEVAPGVYRVRARWKGLERVIEEVVVEAGASSVQSVSFGPHGE